MMSQFTPQLIRLQSTDSTNEEAFRLHAKGEAAPFFVTAEEQTHGRGRSGREWNSPKGNLYLSCLLTNPAPPNKLSQLGFVAGVALIDALIACTHSKCFHLKWPNDVLVDGAKLAGLLLETRLQETEQAVVVGWGVNITSTPKDLPYRAIDLKAISSSIEIEPLCHQLMQAFMLRLLQWDGGENFLEIRELWLQFALPPGTPLMIRAGASEQLQGVFQSIDDGGSLLLKTANETRRILAGDVILPGAA
jgi:BirA family biotin operon repressor/biotin-[acetyl-CoA-carboxylase] ligase